MENKMKEELKLYLTRMLLLETEDYLQVLSAVKKYRTNPTKDARNNLIVDFRKRLTEHAKNLMTDEQINKFINDIPKMEEIEEILP